MIYILQYLKYPKLIGFMAFSLLMGNAGSKSSTWYFVMFGATGTLSKEDVGPNPQR